jgi:hypothetical protein
VGHVTVSVTRGESVDSLSTCTSTVMVDLNISLACLGLIKKLCVVVRSSLSPVSKRISGR